MASIRSLVLPYSHLSEALMGSGRMRLRNPLLSQLPQRQASAYNRAGQVFVSFYFLLPFMAKSSKEKLRSRQEHSGRS